MSSRALWVCLSLLSIVCVSVCVCVVCNKIDHLNNSLFVIKPIESWKETVEVVQHERRFRLQARSCQCPRRTYRMIPMVCDNNYDDGRGGDLAGMIMLEAHLPGKRFSQLRRSGEIGPGVCFTKEYAFARSWRVACRISPACKETQLQSKLYKRNHISSNRD